MTWRHVVCSAAVGVMSSCTTVYAVQVGAVDDRKHELLRSFEVIFDSNDLDVEDVANHIPVVQDVAAYFAIGPRTGQPMAQPHFASQLLEAIYRKCPSGQVTGLTSSRTVTDYSFVTRHKVRVTGYCIIEEGR